VKARARAADRELPPAGRFVDVGGVRLHYVSRGEGLPVVLLHASFSMLAEVESSGLVDVLARHYRVIAFDRPGFGCSDPPDDGDWSAQAQASRVASALAALGVERAIVVSHSSAAQVAIALALDHPRHVRGLVLVSGVFFPSRVASLLSMPAWPVVGGFMMHAGSPLAGRALWPALVRIVFGPSRPPAGFRRLPKWSFLKPSRLGAAARESRTLATQASRLAGRYGAIRTPTVILAGERDRVASVRRQARRMHRRVPHSELEVVPGVGHMLHHIVPRRVLRAIDAVALADARGLGPPGETNLHPPLRELLADVPRRS
jgi:pimeloyl-ACP methyl ester carboxylesterase